MNGRLDLAQVEGLGDLLAAETAAQRRQALALMDGALSRLGGGLEPRAAAGAGLRRGDDRLRRRGAAGDAARDGCAADLGEVAGGDAAGVSRGSRLAERVRDGFEVALVGRPNVGKSTLLNALAGREVALTSEIAGTTRDVIEVRLDLDGLALTLARHGGAARRRWAGRGAGRGARARARRAGGPAAVPGETIRRTRHVSGSRSRPAI